MIDFEDTSINQLNWEYFNQNLDWLWRYFSKPVESKVLQLNLDQLWRYFNKLAELKVLQLNPDQHLSCISRLTLWICQWPIGFLISEMMILIEVWLVRLNFLKLELQGSKELNFLNLEPHGDQRIEFSWSQSYRGSKELILMKSEPRELKIIEFVKIETSGAQKN